MRYFVLMSDGTVATATNICEGPFYDGTHFTVGNIRFKYSPNSYLDETCGYHYIKYLNHDKPFYKFKPEYDEWYATDDIKYLLFLNEEEDEEMNYFQSTDFNAGIIYAYLERAMGSLITRSDTESIKEEISLPKIQVVPKWTDALMETKVLEATLTAVSEHFAAVYGNRFDVVLTHDNDPIKKQYIVFKFQVRRKEERKEMTITEIEEALGYKIKVVGEK